MKRKRKWLTLALVCIMLFSACIPAYADGTTGSGWLDIGLGWVQSTADYFRENIPAWKSAVEEYFLEIRDDPDVQAAWNTLTEAADHAGSVSKEAVQSAYETVKAWMENNNISENAASAFHQLAEAAGVDQAQIDAWYDTVGDFITSGKEAVSDGVLAAWDVIREAQPEITAATEEAVQTAYETVSNWLAGLHTEEAAEASEALDHIMAQESTGSDS